MRGFWNLRRGHARKNFFDLAKLPNMGGFLAAKTLCGSLISRGNFFLRDRWGVIREFAIGPLGERNKTFILVRKI